MSLKSWLLDEPVYWKLPIYILFASFTLLAIGITIGSALYFLEIDTPPRPDIETLVRMEWDAVISIVLVWVLAEEFFFRFLPIMIGRSLLNSMPITILLCLISSIIFGYLHGNHWNILVQGVIGMGFCLIYLKCGGINKKIVKPYLTTSAVHFLYNIFLFAPNVL